MAWGAIGFFVSFYLFHDYASYESKTSNQRKYASYAMLKDSVWPAIKTGDADFISKTSRQFFGQVHREIFKPY